MAKGNESSYLLVAAIDFGTTFSGFAFSTRHDFEKDPTNTNIKRWIDPTSSMVYNKTSTCILFTKEKKFNSFGFEAEAKYLDLVLDNEHKNWYFFRRFKMTLYEFEVILSLLNYLKRLAFRMLYLQEYHNLYIIVLLVVH